MAESTYCGHTLNGKKRLSTEVQIGFEVVGALGGEECPRSVDAVLRRFGSAKVLFQRTRAAMLSLKTNAEFIDAKFLSAYGHVAGGGLHGKALSEIG
jgi:hypothetical protein